MKWISLLALVFKAIIILILLNLADITYHTYNNNYPSVELFSINIWLLWTIISILLFNKLWMRISLLSLILFTMLMQYLFFQYFGTFVQPIGFYQVFNNTNEVIISFIDELQSMIIPITIIIAIFISIVMMKMIKHWQSYRNNILGVVILLSIFSINIYDTYQNLHSKSGKLRHKQIEHLLPLPYHHSTINYMRSLNYFLVGIMPKKILSNTIQIFPVLSPPRLKDRNISRNIILVIGESLRAKEIGMLGYKEDTTPLLKQINGLYASSIYAAGTMTKTSVSAQLNRVQYPGATEQMNSQKNNLFRLAKQNGFITHFYSAQSNKHLTILQNYIGKKFIDNYASRQMLKKKINNPSPYDMALVQIIKSINLNKGNHFIVLQQRGSHSPYHKQYPKSFNKFEKKYDNTVLYTDYVLSSLIKDVISASSKPTYIIFSSDHGELLHEYGRNGHGWFFEEVYRVPFFYYSAHQEQDIINNIPLSNIQSHFQESNLIAKLLGYDINISKEQDIYINGSDVDALAGYLHIKLDSSGNEKSIEKVQ